MTTLIRNIKYMNHSKAGKKAVALRTQFIEPTLGKARRQLVKKCASYRSCDRNRLGEYN